MHRGGFDADAARAVDARHAVRLCAAAAVCLGISAPCASWADADPSGGTFSLVLQNDVFVQADGHYTSGVKASWISPLNQVPRLARSGVGLLRWVNADAADMRIEYSLGQDIYTPVDLSRADPDPRDRPYAGWLYFSVGVAAVENRRLDQLQITLGVVGPSSLAEEIQRSVHEFIKARNPQGWDAQLHDEPGVMLSYHRTWQGPLGTTVRGFQAEVSPYVGGALGNVMTYGDVGATARLGPDLPDRDYGPPRIDPTAVGTGYFSPTPGFRWYLFASAGARVVLHNIFLDGNTFRDSRSVDKRLLMGDFQLGLVLSWRQLRLAYTQAFRTPEFQDQKAGDRFGAVSLSFQF